MDTDSFKLSLNTNDIIREKLEDIIDFGKLNDKHELFSNKNKKVIRKFKIGTPKSIWIDEFVCLRSKMYSLKCGDNSKNKLKGISKSQSKHIKFGEYYNCLFDGQYQNNVILIIFDQLTMKNIFKNYKNLHYLNAIINDVI